MSTNIEKIVSLINSFIQAYAKFDIEMLNKLIDEKFEFKNISQGETIETTSTNTEFALVLEQSKILFSSRDIEIESINIKGSNVEINTLISATMAIGTPDGLKAGQKIIYKANFIVTFSDNIITQTSIIS